MTNRSGKSRAKMGKTTDQADDEPAKGSALPDVPKATLEQLRAMLSSVLKENFALRKKVCDLEEKINLFIEPAANEGTFAGENEEPLSDAVTPDAEDGAAEPATDGKDHYDLLILSDSIYRHAGVSCPKEEGMSAAQADFLRCSRFLPKTIDRDFEIFKLKCKKIIVPGARAPRLLSEVALLRQRCT